MPSENYEYSAEDSCEVRREAGAYARPARRARAPFREHFFRRRDRRELGHSSKSSKTRCRSNLETQVQDPALRDKLRPDYRPACKRLIISGRLSTAAVQRPNVEVVTEGIEAISSQPVCALATVSSTNSMCSCSRLASAPIGSYVRPRCTVATGRSLAELWSKRPSAYYSVAVPQLPNFFMLNGPNSPVGNFSLIEVAELQMRYILQLVDLLRAGECRANIAPSESAADSFEARADGLPREVRSGPRDAAVGIWMIAASLPHGRGRWRSFRADLAAPDLSAFERD